MTDNAEQRLVEAKDCAWLGEVAALDESLKRLGIRQSEAQQPLSHGSNRFAQKRQNKPTKLLVAPRPGGVAPANLPIAGATPSQTA